MVRLHHINQASNGPSPNPPSRRRRRTAASRRRGAAPACTPTRRRNFVDAARQRLPGRILPALLAASAVRFAFAAEEVAANELDAARDGALARCPADLHVEERSRCSASRVVWLLDGGCCADMDSVRVDGPSCYLPYEYEFMSLHTRHAAVHGDR